MKLRAREDDQVESSRAAAMKFTYPSGSRPLDGYTIKRGVGRGGFGEVYFATSDAGKEVALKLIRRNLDVELRGVTQCLNLKHSNLIGLYDIRSDEQEDEWVIMEFVSGQSLDDVIDRHPGGLPIDEAVRWMRGICNGVAYLHDHGIVHRDLKPGNIFSDEGTVKVGDYGLAKFISCSRRSGQTESVGTVHYMAPEISNGRYGKEIDTYALGIILYELLTGKVPFEGESVGEVLMKHLTAEPDLDILPEPFRDIVRRALAKDPDVRFKNVGEMLALLPSSDAKSDAAGTDIPAPSQPAVATHAVGAYQAPADTIVYSPEVASGANEAEVEPIYRALCDSWDYCERAWNDANIHPLLRVVLMFGGVTALVVTCGIWLPALFAGFFIYGIYYAVRGLVLQHDRRHRRSRHPHQADARRAGQVSPPAATEHRGPPTPAGSANPPRPIHPQRERRLRKHWRVKVQQELATKPFRDKLSELLGSMLLAALVCSIVALLAPLLVSVASPSQWIALHLWLTIVGTLGSWAVLIPTKFSEGKVEDHVPLRFLLLVLGAGVGAAAWGLGDLLTVDQPYWHNFGASPSDTVAANVFDWNYSGEQPRLRDFVAYFASLFVLVRWWRLADYTRTRRLSIWSIAVCLFWAFCLHYLWWFPQPAGMMIAGVIAAANQLSSPWLPPSKRRVFAEEAQAA